MLTIEEKIARYEHFAKLCGQAEIPEWQEECEQLAEWLRELSERRKMPEIITCGECKWYGRANKQRFYRGMDCLQRRISTIVPDKDFCSRAERKDGETDG